MHYILSIIYVLFLSISCSDFSLAIDDERLHLEQKFSKNIYEFHDRSFFNKVFSHPGIEPSNKISFGHLELIGDKILGFVITDHLCLLNPDQDEGWVSKTSSKIVSNKHNATVAKSLGLSEYIKINPIHNLDKKGECRKILADTCEALIGAIYKDKGIDAAKKFILENWFKKPENISQKKEEKCEEMSKTSVSSGLSSDNIQAPSAGSRQFCAASSGEPKPKRFNKSDFPKDVSLDDSQEKLRELCIALNKGVPDYRIIQEKKKSATVMVSKYGVQEAEGNNAQKLAAKEMYKKITGEMISLKEAKKALEEICKQRNLGEPFYTSDPDSSFTVHVWVGNLQIGGAWSFKSLENAKKLAAQESYKRLLEEASYRIEVRAGNPHTLW